MFFFSKYKKIFFSLYSQKQVFENRKQKMLPNITLSYIYIYIYISTTKHIIYVSYPE